MSTVTFADVALPILSFSPEREDHALVLELINSPWVQRLREITQTGNTSLVYMFSEHSRFGHSLGVAYLASLLLDALAVDRGVDVEPYRLPVIAAALLHDLGHIAPGSHTAHRVWFPGEDDSHEEVTIRIIGEDPSVRSILEKRDPRLPMLVQSILREEPELPPWTWQAISGGGWNVDRGNWCLVDSALAGVSYGRYNVPAILDSLIITDCGSLAVTENRLDAITHFAVARHSMYRQVYQHRVLLAADMLTATVVKRAREVSLKDLGFVDEAMKEVLAARSCEELSLKTVNSMRESWWRYHLIRWQEAADPILSDLASRLVSRRLLKTVRIREGEDTQALYREALNAVRAAGFDPDYYLHEVVTTPMHAGDRRQFMLVKRDDGSLHPVSEVEPLVGALLNDAATTPRRWLALPHEAKLILGRSR